MLEVNRCLRHGVLGAALALLTACGQQQSANSSAATPAASQPNTTAPVPANGATAASDSQQSMSLAELTAGSTASNSSFPAVPASAPDNPVRSAVSASDMDTEYARVVSVQPVKERVCTDQTVTERRRHEDRHQVAGTVIGALVGGAIGNRIGRGSGRTIATIGGAVGGGAIGKHIQKEHQENDTVTHVVRRCHSAAEQRRGQDMTLYDVLYDYAGQAYKVRLDYDPGDRVQLPVRGVVESLQ